MLGAAPDVRAIGRLFALVALACLLGGGIVRSSFAETSSLALKALTPSDGATLSGLVRWEAEVAGGTVSKVDFYVDGQQRWTEENAPFVFHGDKGTLDTTTLPDGQHTLMLRAIGTGGEKVESAITILVANSGSPEPPPAEPPPSDPTPPPLPPPPPSDATFSVAATTPTPGQTVSGKVAWEATVAGAKATRVEFFIDSRLRWAERNAPYDFSGNNGTWDTTQEANGPHTLTLKAYYEGGSAQSSITVEVANGTGETPPPPPDEPPPPPTDPDPVPPPTEPEPPVEGAFHVDGGNRACSDTGAGSLSQPFCTLARAAKVPANSHVLVKAKGSSYGNVEVFSAGTVFEGENAPDVSALTGPVDPAVFAGRVMPEVRDVDIRASGVVWRGFRHVGVSGDMASLDARQATNVRFEGNDIDYGGVRLRNADRTTIRGNNFHNGPTQTDGRAEIYCPCGVLVGNYNDGSGTNGSDDVTIQFNHWRDWRGDVVNVQNRASRTRILHNKGVHVEREPGSDEHTDTFQLVGSGDVMIVGNDFRDVQHGILITDHTPEDRNGDGWAIWVANNIIEARQGRSFLGPLGPGSRVVNNTFVRAPVYGNDWAGECDVDWTESRDPGDHSTGAVFANNFCKGSPTLADSRITQSANIWIPRFVDFGFLAGYTLTVGSPAIDAANPVYAPATDMLGRARNGLPDVGAKEWNG